MADKNMIETLNNQEIITSIKNDEDFIKYGDAELEKDDEQIECSGSESEDDNQSIKTNDDGKHKLPRKQQIIKDIKKLYRAMGIECPSDNKLSKTRVTKLEQELVRLTNKSLTCNMDPEIIKKSNEKDKQLVKQPAVMDIADDIAGDALYNINFLMINTIENVTNSFDLPISLDGLTKRMDQTKKDELKKVLLRIVGNHGAIIKPLLSPTAMYAFIMLTTMQETIADNLKKKSEIIK